MNPTDEITELKNKLSLMEKQLIKNQKMASLGSLVAGVAHEVSTPIGLGVTGMSHFIDQTHELKKLFETQEMTQEDFESYLRDAEKTADIVYTNLINAKNTIQSFKRVSVDQSSEAKRKFELGEYIDEITISLHNKIKHTNIKISNQVDKNILINSFAGSFAHIFTNLIMNSLIHGFAEGESGEVIICATQDNTNIYIDYSDNGAGISSENIDKIYDAFFTTKADEGGSGLGMQIIHSLITKQLQGSISVKSKMGEGVLFNIILPKELS